MHSACQGTEFLDYYYFVIVDIPYWKIVYLQVHFYIMYSDDNAGWQVLFNFSLLIGNNIFINDLILLTLNSPIIIHTLG
jgi:hypothetical protein